MFVVRTAAFDFFEDGCEATTSSSWSSSSSELWNVGERQITCGTIVFRCESERESAREREVNRANVRADEIGGDVRRRLFGGVQTGNWKSGLIMT